LAHALHRGPRIDRGDLGPPSTDLLNDDVAGEHDTDLIIFREGFVSERRVAGSKDAIFAEVDPKLLFQGSGNVDFGQHAEPLLLERLNRSCERVLKPRRYGACNVIAHPRLHSG
jgi:hypothetical protein